MKWLIILLVVVVILVVACVLLYRKGKQMQEQAESSQEQMRAGSQVQSLLVIDKKKMKLQDANLPKIVMEQAKVPVVKVKIGPKIVTMLCDEKVYDLIPVKKEVKAVVSGIYIMDIKGARGGVEQKEEKKGFFARFKKK